MRILITGSRNFSRPDLVQREIACSLMESGDRLPFTIVHGACLTGADQIADEYCRRFPEYWTIESHPANWYLGRAAGPIRNQEMVDMGADLCLAFFELRESNRGTDHCSTAAEAAGIEVRRICSDGTVFEPGQWPGLRNWKLLTAA